MTAFYYIAITAAVMPFMCIIADILAKFDL